MILTAHEIEWQMSLGKIVISDFDKARLNPNSYNLRISDKLYTYKEKLLNLKTIKKAELEEVIIPADGFVLQPDTLYLGSTLEYTETYDLVPKIDGRSSVGRAGLFVHVTAGFGDIGFCGHWTLEFHAVQPIVIYPFAELCQISYHAIQGDVRQTYNGNYQNNKGVQGSKFAY